MKKRSSDSDSVLFLMILSLITEILEGIDNNFVPPKSFQSISRFMKSNIGYVRSNNKDDWKGMKVKDDAAHNLNHVTDWLAQLLATLFTINKYLNQIRSAEDMPTVNLAERANRLMLESKEQWTNLNT